MRAALAVAAVLLLAGAAFWLSRGSESGVATTVDGSPGPPVVLDAPAELETPEPLDALPQDAATVAPERTANRREALATEEPPVAAIETVSLQGTLIAVDEFGEALCASGSLAIVPTFVGARVGERRTVSVVNGAWSCRVEPCDELLLRAAVCNGMRAEFLPGGRTVVGVPFPDDGFLDLRVTALPGLSIRVVDADSGADLDGVLLLKAETRAPHQWTFPPRNTVVENGRSPVVIPHADQHRRSYWVWAPGHAWKRAVFPEDSSDCIVALERSGDLQVVIENCSRKTRQRFRPRLHIERRSAAPAAESSRGEYDSITTLRPMKDDQLLRDLAPGAYRLQVRTARTPTDDILLGQTEVWVESGSRATAVVRVDDIPAAPPAGPLRGTLRFHESWADGVEDWSLASPSLLIRPTTQSPLHFSTAAIAARAMPRDGVPLFYDWDVDRKPEGEYIARVTPSQLEWTVATGAPNHIEIAEAGHVIVTFESDDDEIAAVLRDGGAKGGDGVFHEVHLGVAWSVLDSNGSRRSEEYEYAPRSDTGECRFAALVGSRVEVGVGGSHSWRGEEQTITVGPGTTRLSLELSWDEELDERTR